MKKIKYIMAFIISQIISLIYFLCMRNYTSSIFRLKFEDSLKIFNISSFVSMILFGIFLFIIYYFIINRKKHKIFLKHFIIYFSIMLVFLILLWPGIFKSDEYYVLRGIYDFEFNYRQHYFTNIFYTISLCTFPSLGTITTIQNIIISSIVAYVLATIEPYFKNKKTIYLMYIPLLLPPVIDNNMFTLRSSLCAYLFLLLAFELIFYIKDEKNSRLIVASIMVLILSNWKSEFLYIPILFVIYIFVFYLKKFGFKKLIISTIIFTVIFFLLGIPQKYDNTYKYTAIMNPLSVIVQKENIRETISEEDFANIEKLASLDILRESYSYTGTPLYWTNIYNKHLTKEEDLKLFISYFKLVINNFDDFIKARLLTYNATNFVVGNTINQVGASRPSAQWDLNYGDEYFYRENYKFTYNKNTADFRHHLICLILLRNYDNFDATILCPLFYNVTYSLIFSLFIMIGFIIKKRFKEAFVLLITITQIATVFVSAPANFWMYYVDAYIVLNMLIAFYALIYIDKNKLFEKYQKLLKFLIVSGSGFLVDFTIYSISTYFFDTNVLITNIISSLISVSYVYLISTRKIFKNNSKTINLKIKYAIYIIYQLIMILFSSYIISLIEGAYSNINIISDFSSMLAKITFTPVTMTCNYLFMKYLIEKLNTFKEKKYEKKKEK